MKKGSSFITLLLFMFSLCSTLSMSGCGKISSEYSSGSNVYNVGYAESPSYIFAVYKGLIHQIDKSTGHSGTAMQAGTQGRVREVIVYKRYIYYLTETTRNQVKTLQLMRYKINKGPIELLVSYDEDVYVSSMLLLENRYLSVVLGTSDGAELKYYDLQDIEKVPGKSALNKLSKIHSNWVEYVDIHNEALSNNESAILANDGFYLGNGTNLIYRPLDSRGDQDDIVLIDEDAGLQYGSFENYDEKYIYAMGQAGLTLIAKDGSGWNTFVLDINGVVRETEDGLGYVGPICVIDGWVIFGGSNVCGIKLDSMDSTVRLISSEDFP